MCGIAGILRVHAPGAAVPRPLDAIPEAWLDILDDSIKHRGPDGRGRFRQRTTRADGATLDVALVHRRLSIIDHVGGAQPMVIGRIQSVSDGPSDHNHHAHASPALLSMEGRPYSPIPIPHICPRCPPGTLAVVFNGCIYNHRELRRELEAAGHVFHTDHSDTEVLIHGWTQWGADLPGHLDGMYAAAIWNESDASLTLMRDFAGEKPMREFSRNDLGLLATCSSAPGLARLGAILGNPERAAASWAPDWCRVGRPEIEEWLQGAGKDAPDVGFEVSPAMNVRAGRSIELHLHPQNRRPRTQSARGPERFGEMIDAAVRSRLEADVPLGCFLSGGVDSSLVAHYAHRAIGNLRTFSVRMPDARYDESPHAERVAAALGTTHETLSCNPEPAADLVCLIHQLGLPFGDSSLLPAHWVSVAARQHVRVALSGDAADELFGGYERYVAKARARPIQHLVGLIPLTLLPDRDPKSRTSKLRRLVRACRTGDLRRASIGAIWDAADVARLHGRRIPIEQCVPLLGAFQELRRQEQSSGPQDVHLNDDLKSDFETYLPDDLLRKTDTASMSVALEVRAPFLAKELAQAALSEPLSSLMPNGQRKGLLRAVARKYLPADIVDRPKMGFAIPISDWFRTDYGGMRQLLLDHLSAADPFPGLADAGINLNMAFVRRMLKEHDDAGAASLWPWKGRDHGQRLYMLLVLSIWCRWLQRVRRGE